MVLVREITSGTFDVALMFATSISALLSYHGFFSEGIPILVGIIGVVLGAPVLFMFLWFAVMTRQIRLSPENVRILKMTPWGATKGKIIDPSTIEQVFVKKKTSGANAAVIISTDAEERDVGAGLSPQALEWLKNCIIAVISK